MCTAVPTTVVVLCEVVIWLLTLLPTVHAQQMQAHCVPSQRIFTTARGSTSTWPLQACKAAATPFHNLHPRRKPFGSSSPSAPHPWRIKAHLSQSRQARPRFPHTRISHFLHATHFRLPHCDRSDELNCCLLPPTNTNTNSTAAALLPATPAPHMHSNPPLIHTQHCSVESSVLLGRVQASCCCQGPCCQRAGFSRLCAKSVCGV